MRSRTAQPFIPGGTLVLAFALTASSLTTPSLAAQDFDIGAQLSFGNDSQLGIGPRVLTPLTSVHPRLHAVYSFDYFFPDSRGDDGDLDYWEIAGSVVRDVRVRKMKSYVGLGAVIARSSVAENIARQGSSRTTLGLNLVGGLRFPESEYTPFVEARAGGRQLVLAGGVLLPR